jgi:pimeloyl-ACP methyl ester carboxylesterase
VLPAILDGLRTDFSRGVELSIGQLGFAEGAAPNSVEFAKTECLRCDSTIGYWDFVACNAFDMRNRIHEVAIPTLVLVGDEDQLTPVKWAAYLADKITNAQLKVIPQAGHFVMLERPDEVNQAIIDYLQQL